MQTAVAAFPQTDYETERGKPTPSKNHSFVQANLIFELMTHFRTQFRFMSEASLKLDGWKSVPDISIFPPMAADFRRDEIRIETAPLGVIEIISPTQSSEDLTLKAEEYFEKGVKSCWLVQLNFRNIYVFSDPENYEIYRHTQILKDHQLGIELDLSKIFI